jgi:hypothetical protein
MADRKNLDRKLVDRDADRNRPVSDANVNREATPRAESPAEVRDRGERTAHGEVNPPQRAEKGKMPRFGSAGSGGAEYEPGPEKP